MLSASVKGAFHMALMIDHCLCDCCVVLSFPAVLPPRAVISICFPHRAGGGSAFLFGFLGGGRLEMGTTQVQVLAVMHCEKAMRSALLVYPAFSSPAPS